MKYRIFKRSARNFEEFAQARKYTIGIVHTIDEARDRCERWNTFRTHAQIARGTKAEFERVG